MRSISRLFCGVSVSVLSLVPSLASAAEQPSQAPGTAVAPAAAPAVPAQAAPVVLAAPAASPVVESAPVAPLATAVPEAPKAPHVEAPRAHTAWYEKLNLRGYTQIRYNRLLETNEDLVNTQGDRSIGDKGGFLIRRARWIVFGDVHPQVSVYFQPDLASSIGDQQHVTILRDYYADLALDKAREFRFRVGQSKVPYGFENMQSSQNRVAFDRSDAINSALKDERDLGVFFYWAPAEFRERFKHLVDSGLKGSGDYGVLALGAYNGQTANQKEQNDTPHVVARVTYPFKFGDQFVELGTGGYYGKYVPTLDSKKGFGGDTKEPVEITDARAHAALVVYPQPIGFQVEYNVGYGPQLFGDEMRERGLHGGYAMTMAKVGNFMPYVRGVMYDGGRKFETNAPRYKIRELETGVEWQPHKNLELTAAYTMAERTNVSADEVKDGIYRAAYEQASGRFLRLQAQINY
jgi:hypothetical protein